MRSSALASLLLLLTACASAPEAPRAAEPSTDAGARADAPAPECREASDCALTRIPEGGCCETLCTPRPVTAGALAALTRAHERCEAERGPCPDPVCPPPRFSLAPACQEGRCTVARGAGE